MSKELNEWQEENCRGCWFSREKQVGTGLPCCTFAFGLDMSDQGKCLTRREPTEKEKKRGER